MIENRSDYKFYIEEDRKALRKKDKPKFFGDYIWKYQILLRKCEYYYNCRKDIIGVFLLKYYQFKLYKFGVKLGFTIPLNCFGPGLRIVHIGTIVINGNAKIGSNCTIHVCVNIGSKPYETEAPKMGNNVYIAPGAKIYGNIIIGDNVFIGANSVVNKSFPEGNVTLVGVPAKSIVK